MGRRKMPKLLDLGLKVVLSVSMVMGSVPTAALAEALDDEPQVEEEAVIGEGQVEEGDLVLADDTTSAEEAVVDEVAPVEDVEPAAEGAVTEEAALSAEVVASDDQEPAEPAPVQEAPAAKDEPEDAGIELVALGSESTEMPVLTEGESIEINLEENEQWVGKFTAPYDGTFTFSSTGHWDTYGILFADEELSDWLTDNMYGSNDNGFSISWNLVEGQSVYLKVLDFYDRAMSCTVTASHGISLSSFECRGTSTLVYDGQPKTPSDVEIGRFGDELYEPLTPGVDYEFIGWADGHTGEQLADEPYEMGNYYAVYEGRGEYIGRYYFPYQIVDGCHLDFGSVWLHEREYLSTGNPVVLDVTVKDAAGNELEEGEDFYFTYYYEGYYEVDDGYGGTYEEWGYNELAEAPSAPGEYYVRALAMGDTYEGGSDYCPFTIKNAKDLYLGRVDLYNQYYETSGDPIEIEATVYDAAGNELVKGQDYVFEYAYWGEVEVDDGGGVTYPDWGYVPLGSAPSEEGSYYVRAVAIGDEYEGATDWYSFEVGEAYDVYNLEFGYISMSKDTFEVGKELVYDLEIYNGNDEQLIEDVDYRIVGFTTEEGVQLDGAPSEVGVYCLVCKGINDYRGTIRIRIVLIEPVNPVDMALGTVDVEIDPNSYWIGIFTAPESGYYSFYSEGDYDTDGYLYSDADLSQYIGGDASGGEGNNFLVTTYLSEGQTVYVQARNCEGVRIGCSVTAIKGARLSALNYTYGQSTFVFDGNPHTPDVTFYDYDASELVDGTDYCLKHILTDEGEILASAPTEIGTYFAVYEGMGNYLGTMEVQFTIVDSSDLSSATITLNTWHPKLIDGSLDLVVTVTDAAGIELVEGVHYVLSYYTFDDNGNQVSVEAPTTTGQYYVQADAIAGGGYTGSTSAYDFTVVDPHDIGIEDYSCYFNNSSSKLLVDGTFDLSDLTLYNDVEDTYLILGTDYRIAGYIDENGAVFTNPPTVSGWYQVVLRGTGRYTGERTCWFSLYNSNDIGGDAYSCYFRGSFNKPLIDGTFDLSDLTLYNEFEDTYLILGTDYEIAGYRDNYGTILMNPPTEPGWYQVVVRGTGGYTGECTCGFRLYDPYDLTGASVSLRGAIQLYDEASDQYDNYFFYEGSPVEPTIAVYLGNGQLPSSAYTVTYGNNDHVHEAGEYATVTVTGVEPYTESITAKYKVVDALDLESFVYRCNSYVMWDGLRDSVDRNYTHIEYLATGQPIKPVMEINYYYDGPNSLSDFPELGVDYTCSYEDANGNAIDAARGLGSYTLVVTGMQGGRLSGTMRIPFTLVDTVDLDRYSDVNLVYNGSYTWGGPYHQGFSIHDLATTVSDLAWKLWRDGVQLVENLDYVVEYVGNTVGDMFEVVFHGIGSYTGTVRSVVYFDKTAQDSFDNRSMVRSTVYGFDSYDLYGSVVYVDSTGAIEAPQVTISGLVQGIDYVVDGVYDQQDAPITTANVGDEVTVKVSGIGAYADASRTFNATVVEGTAAPAMNDPMVYLLLQNAWSVYINGSNQYFMKRGETPAVYLQVYGKNLLLQEGQGFSVTTALSDDNNTMSVTAVADDGGLVSGSDTLTVNLRDAFDFNEVLNLNQSLGYVGVTGLDDTAHYQVGSSNAATLNYRGYAFVPSVSFMRIEPEYTAALYRNTRSAGTAVDAITGPGDYTMVITGTGDWSGTFEVPLHVVDASDEGLALSRCQIDLGDAQLVNGKAEPTVTVSYGDTTFTKDTDYTVEYGNNTTAGAHAWVRVTAVEGGRLTGLRSFGFTVADNATSKNLSSGRYSLLIQDPTAYHGASYYPANGHTMRAHAVGDEPRVLVVDEATSTPLTSSDYDVTYGNNMTPGGLAYVTVTGKDNYTGSRSANYYVYGADERSSIENAVVTVEDQTFTGAELNPAVTVTLDGTTLTEGTDYTVTYSNAVHVGTATVTVLGRGGYKGAASGTFQIAPYQLTDDAVSGVEDKSYAGGAEVTLSNLTVTALGKTLVAGTDYEVAYQNNTQVGEATVTVTGKGDYAGTVTKTFQILGNSLSGATISAIADQTYTGSAIEPAITVTLGDKTLAAGTDYTVSYANNVNAGTATVTVTGTGEYFDSAQATFVIVGKPVTVTATSFTKTYGDPDSEFGVSFEGLLAGDSIDYTISREPGENVGKYAITPAGEEVQGNYVVTFVAGELTITSKYLSETMVGGIDNKTYTGAEVTQDGLFVRDGDTTLVAGVDYTVAYGSNINVGTVWVTVVGKGNYTGSASMTFQIMPKPVEGLQIEGEAKTYTGSALTTTVTVKDGEKVLVEGTDFTVESYDNNVNAGTGTFVVKGKGNYGGQAEGTFTINGKPVTVTATSVTKTYGDTDPEFGVSVEGLLAGDEIDYTISRESGENVGEYAITLTGDEVQGNYVVSFVAGELTINAKTLTEAMVSALADKTYTGSEITQDLVVTDGDKVLVKDTDYNVAYSKNINVSTETDKATVTITGIGNYTGSIEQHFVITAKLLTDDSITVTTNNVVYSGKAATTTFAVKDGSSTLVKGTDYTVAYVQEDANRVNVGSYQATITGTGNYDGELEVTFQVTPKPVTVTANSLTKTYGEDDSPLKATVEGFVEGDDVDFSYELSRAEGEDVGTYDITVAITSEVSGNYTVTVIDGTFTINPKTITVTANDAAKTYRAADPTFTATVEGLVEPDTEAIISYEFTREAGANVGTYAITPSGDEVQGNYRLTFVPGTLTIKPRSIAKATIAPIAAKTYTGSALKPKLTVKDGTKTLVLNTDYTVTYKDNVKKGTATVTIKGKGNYSGSTSTTFKINAASVAKATVSKIANQRYDGTAKKPSPTVKVGTRTLKKGTDYTLAYKNNVKAGTATVTIKGKGNYTGTKSVTFKIVAMAGTWKGSGSKWWYQWKDGTYPKSVFLDISGKTYYFDASGYCVYGWKKIGGKDYYFESSGAMAKSKWVGNYYLGADGAMLVNTVTPDGWQVDKNGKAVKKVA